MVSPTTLLATTLALCTPLIHALPSSLAPRASTPACKTETSGFLSPVAGSTITQAKGAESTVVEILYCSGQYFKTRPTGASIWLTKGIDSALGGGPLLAQNVVPDDHDAAAGFHSYRFNVTIYPEDGSFMQGPYTLSVYETSTGELS